jgi:hypothetical protein
MRIGMASASRRGFRRFAASGAIVVLSGTALVVAGSNADVGATNNYTRACLQGFAARRIAHLNAPLVDMATTPTDRGCWLLGSDGGVFSFGDAQYYGSAAKLGLVSPIVGLVPTSDGRGYWLFAADGGVFNFGDAQYYGSAGGAVRANPIVGMRVNTKDTGYSLTDSAGKVYMFKAPARSGARSAAADARPTKVELKAERKAARKAARKVAKVGLRHNR